MSGRIKINNAQCLTVSANGSLNSDTNTVDYAPSFFANSNGARFSVFCRLVILVYKKDVGLGSETVQNNPEVARDH